MEKLPLLEDSEVQILDPTPNLRSQKPLPSNFFIVSLLLLILLGSLLYLKVDAEAVSIDNWASPDPNSNLNPSGVVVLQEEPPPICVLEPWNFKWTESFPDYEYYVKLAKIGVTGGEGMGAGELRLISAFLYEEYIVVTTSHQDKKDLGGSIYCRYFDCNRLELPNSKFQSIFFPMTAVHCARRVGAEFISLTFGAEEKPQEPIPLVSRLFESQSPPHEVGVCVGQIYGDERKWLEILEYVEHHRLIGASMFYFTVFEMDGYTKKVMEEYQRLGLAEVSFVNTEYQIINILFHQIQLAECFFRSKFHSKWVINVDIDERLTLQHAELFRPFLRNLHPSICEIIFGNRRVPKMEKDPETFETEEKLIESMEFLRYHNTSDAHWAAPKIVFRPDKVHNIYMHWSWRQRSGCRIASVPLWIGYIRHYRFVGQFGLGNNWLQAFNTTHQFPLDPQFAENLKNAVVEKVKYLYNLKPIPCEHIEPFFKEIYGNDTLKCVEKEKDKV